jgi:hypothetical protein
MGLMLEVQCLCGYAARSYLGAGMSDFETSCAGPALCKVCAQVVTVELMDTPPRCPDCEAEVARYGNLAVHEMDESSGRSALIQWNLPDGRTFSLSGADRYRCPSCTEATMTFEVMGFFD